MPIDWVFFDVGNVLYNDDPQAFVAFEHYHRAIREIEPGYSFEEMLADREELARAGRTWILGKLGKRRLPEERVRSLYEELRGLLIERYDEHHLPHPGAEEVLAELAGKYRLGVIANQPPECRSSLERRGLLRYFEVVAISDELDLHKPDARIFEWALKEAGAAADRSVMIGDRRDNDVGPARALGMRTIWLRWQSSAQKNWRPISSSARTFLESCDRVPMFHSLLTPETDPDRTVASLGEIPPVVADLDR